MSDTTTQQQPPAQGGDQASGGSQPADQSKQDQQLAPSNDGQGNQPVQQGVKPQGSDSDGTDWKAEARKHEGRAKKSAGEVEKANADKAAAEKATADAQAAHQKLIDALAEATGTKKSDQPPDPAELQRTIADSTARNKALDEENAGLRTELAAWKSAVENGANPLHLMDRRSFLDELAKLDRNSDKFGEQLDAAVKAAVERDESLKAAGTPRTPKPDPSQGSGRPAPTGAERGMAEAAKRGFVKTNT